MINLDNELAEGFFAVCGEHLSVLETELLAIEKGGVEFDEARVDRAFRAVHSVRGGALFLDLLKIGELAHKTEDILALVRARKLVPTPERVDVILRASNRLQELILNPAASHTADIAGIMAALASLSGLPPSVAGRFCPAEIIPPADRPLRVLLVEDDFVSRLVLQSFLSRYGDCHVAVNGREAVEACREAAERGPGYDLICMDIMMPEMDGREAVRQIRAIEETHGAFSHRRAKIIMTTTVDDIRAVFQCFKELCDAYLTKPIDLARLLGHMKSWQLIK